MQTTRTGLHDRICAILNFLLSQSAWKIDNLQNMIKCTGLGRLSMKFTNVKIAEK